MPTFSADDISADGELADGEHKIRRIGNGGSSSEIGGSDFGGSDFAPPERSADHVPADRQRPSRRQRRNSIDSGPLERPRAERSELASSRQLAHCFE